MKIGLFGFTLGHENLGCQALTCAFLELLERNVSEKRLEVVFFTNERYMGAIPELFPNLKMKKVGVSLKRFPPTFFKEAQSCDVLFDVTYGDGFSDIYFVRSVYRDALIKYMLGKYAAPFVLAPQTYGPFKRKTLEYIAGKAIKASTYAYARDQISADYATRISRQNIKTVTDIAFALSFNSQEKISNKIRLGINVSGLLWKGGFSESNQFGLRTDYRIYCKKLVDNALAKGYEVHIIPHVTKAVDPNREIPDGDYSACEELARQFNNKLVHLAPCFESPYDAKNYIASMDFFVGARMHATIAAFSSGVITIPFAYSRKFKGLYENLNYPFYVDGTVDDTERTLDKTLLMIEEGEKLAYAQKAAMEKVKSKVTEFEQELKKIVASIE